MKIIGVGEGKVIVEMENSEWASLQYASDASYDEQNAKTGAEANVVKIDDCLNDYKALGEFSEDVTKLVNLWKRIKARTINIGKLEGGKK